MNESNNIKEIPSAVDSLQVSKDIEEAVSDKPYVSEKKVKLSWDKKQFIVRIPKEIAEEMDITKESQIIFKLIKQRPGMDEGQKLEISLVI